MNRDLYLRDTLEGIAKQATPDTEVVIVDGGSTDETAVVVESFRNRICLVYRRQAAPGGVDKDFDAAVSLASGAYCWLMSDDDELRPGALARVRSLLSSGKLSLVVVNASICNEDFSAVLNDRFVIAQEDRHYEVGEDERLFIDTGNYLTFIGCVVIRRALWLERQREPYFGSLFIHVGIIFQAPLPAPAVLVAEPLVGIRYGNAQWSARAFEIWMFKWPALVWSFRFSDAAKSAVCRRDPWARPQTLLLHRAKGSYTLSHYRKWLRTLMPSMLQRILARFIAVAPIMLVNVAVSLALKIFVPGSGVALTDLRNSRYRSLGAIKRATSALRRSPSMS